MSKMNEVTEKITEGMERIEEGVVTGYQKIESGVVDGYQKIESAVVGGFTKIADSFVDRFLTKDGESVEEAKARMAREQAELEEQNRARLEKSMDISRNAGKRE